MKFETILDAYRFAILDAHDDALNVSKHYPCHSRQRDAFRARLELMYEKAYYHGVNVGLEVADPELYGEDHVAL